MERMESSQDFPQQWPGLPSGTVGEQHHEPCNAAESPHAVRNRTRVKPPSPRMLRSGHIKHRHGCTEHQREVAIQVGILRAVRRDRGSARFARASRARPRDLGAPAIGVGDLEDPGCPNPTAIACWFGRQKEPSKQPANPAGLARDPQPQLEEQDHLQAARSRGVRKKAEITP